MSAILAAILDFSKILFFCKTATNFTEISREHVCLASNTKKEEFRTNFPKILQFSVFNFNLHN